MKRLLAHRPTPAMAVACVALFVALGGVSYGVATGSIDGREILDNTVRSKDVRDNNLTTRDLRNNEVRGIDIRNNTIRGRDIATNTLTDDQVDESKLQQVPDAARLGGRPASDYASAQSEPVRSPTLAPGFALDPSSLAPGFWKDPLGVVRLQGTVVDATGPAFTLPAGYRPAGTARFAIPSGTATVNALGVVNVDVDPASLDGIAFRAD